MTTDLIPAAVSYELVAPVSFDLPRAAAACGLSVRELQHAIRDGDLVAHYRGTKPLIEFEELKAFVRALPTARPVKQS